jgi:hypothetical protein
MDQRFRYGGTSGMLMRGAVLFGACGVSFVYLLLSNDPIRIGPLPESAGRPATIVLAILAFGMAGVAALQIVLNAILGARYLVLGESFLEAPRSPRTKQTVRVERSAIRGVQEMDVAGSRVVTIQLDGSKLHLSNRTVGDDGYAATLAWLRKE